MLWGSCNVEVYAVLQFCYRKISGTLIHYPFHGLKLVRKLLMVRMYQVQRVRDGKHFATRRVDAIQKGNIVFTLLAPFQV